MKSYDTYGNPVLLAQCHLPGELYDGAVRQAESGLGIPMVISGDQETGLQFLASTVMPPFPGENPTLLGDFITKTRMPEGDMRVTSTPAVAKAEIPSRGRRLVLALAGLPVRQVRLSIWSDVGSSELPQ